MGALLEPVLRAGETFLHDPAITEEQAHAAWVEQSQAVMVAADPSGVLVGTLPGAFRHQRLDYVDALVMVQFSGDRACNLPVPDRIQLSDRATFHSAGPAPQASSSAAIGSSRASGLPKWPWLRRRPGLASFGQQRRIPSNVVAMAES